MKENNVKGKDILGCELMDDKEYNIKIYDFKRPDKFSRDQIRTVSIIHDTFARLSTTTLSASLRKLMHVGPPVVDQLTYEEFIRAIPNPTTLAIVNMDPLKGSAVLEIDPQVTFCIIDRLFGGQGEINNYSRDLSDIEQSVMEEIIIRILKNLRESWSTIIGLTPRLGHIETNPMFAQIVPPREMVILIKMQVNAGGGKAGMINLCIPFLTIEPIIHKLSARYCYSSPRIKKNNVNINLSNLKVDSEIYVKAEKLTLKQIGELSKNTLIKMPEYQENTAYLDAGKKNLINLKLSETKESYSFSLEEKEMFLKKDLEIIQYKKKETDTFNNLETNIKSAISELADKINNNIRKIDTKIDDLNKRQDEITDQIIFNSAGKDLPKEILPATAEKKPFSFISSDDLETLFTFIQNEHPQLIALVMSYLEPGFASSVISKFDETLQADIINRISNLDRTAPEVIHEIERVLNKILQAAASSKIYRAGGINSVTKILNVSSKNMENNILETLKKSNPELALEIKKQMIFFEDIIKLDKKILELLVLKTDRKNMLLALKASDEKVKKAFISVMKDSESFKKELELSGPVRLNEAETAQFKIISILKELEESGEI